MISLIIFSLKEWFQSAIWLQKLYKKYMIWPIYRLDFEIISKTFIFRRLITLNLKFCKLGNTNTNFKSLWPLKAVLLEYWEKDEEEAFTLLWQLLDYRHYTDVSIIRKICKRSTTLYDLETAMCSLPKSLDFEIILN